MRLERFDPMMREHQIFDLLNNLVGAVEKMGNTIEELVPEKEEDTVAGLLSEDTKELVWQYMERQATSARELNLVRMTSIISRTIEEFSKSNDDAYNLSLACYIHILAVSLYSERHKGDL